MSTNYMTSWYIANEIYEPCTFSYTNKVEHLCCVCGGCDNIGSCKQQEELIGCTNAQ
jgi:hypothetical protein